MKKLYIVKALHKEVTLGIGKGIDIDLSWIDGQIGALPVFSNKQKAMRAGGDVCGLLIMEKQKEKSK